MDDFEDGNARDGVPVEWLASECCPGGFRAEAGDLVVSDDGQDNVPTGVVANQTFDGDLVVKALVRFDGVVSVFAHATGGTLYHAIYRDTGKIVLRRFDPEFDGNTLASLPVAPPDPRTDHWLELSVDGQRVEFRVWESGGPRPDEPQIYAVDGTYRSGTCGVAFRAGPQGGNARFGEFSVETLCARPATLRRDFGLGNCAVMEGDTVEVRLQITGLRPREREAGFDPMCEEAPRTIQVVDDLGPTEDPAFEHAHAIGGECPGTEVEAERGSLTVSAHGEDIWQNGDTFVFVYSEITGDFSARVVIDSREFAADSRWGKMGIMARQDCSPTSRYSYLHDIGPAEGQTRMSSRPTHGGSDDNCSPCSGSLHFHELRLDRRGSEFIGYVRDGEGRLGEPDDDLWVAIGSEDWGEPANCGSPAREVSRSWHPPARRVAGSVSPSAACR